MSEDTCSISGCDVSASARGLCRRHYAVWWRRDRTDATPMRPHVRRRVKPLGSRFWAKVDKFGPKGCWMWTALADEWGYGRIRIDGRQRKAHRVAYELAFGPIPDGLWVLHRCDNPPCVNPAHLFLGSHADNMADMVAKGRGRSGGLRGTQLSHARLTEEAVAEIRRVTAGHKRGSRPSDAEFALRFGVCEETVRKARIGETWKHVAA